MYRDRLTELRGGSNYNYNQIKDSQYDDDYDNYGSSRSNNYGNSRSNNYGNSRSNNYGNSRSNNYGSSRSNNYESSRSNNGSRSNNYGGAYSRNNGYNSPPGSPGYSRNGGGDVSSQYSGRINNINSDVKAIWDYIDKLDSLYNRNYNEVRRAETAENSRRITELEERVTAEIQRITNQLKSLKAEAERISNPRDKKMVLSQINNASNNLKKVFDSYNDKRMRNVEQGRNKMIRQYQIVHKNASQEEAERYVDSHPGGALQYSLLGGSKQAYDEAQQRHDQMEQINQSINELCDLFQDMNNMLITQNETINIIEENVDNAEYNVEEASKELTRAIEIRKSSRKKLWIITIIILIVLLILFIWLCFTLRPLYEIFIKPFLKLLGGGDDNATTATTQNQGQWDPNQGNSGQWDPNQGNSGQWNPNQ
ncbi:t-SNARE [Anaeromyces robustus]|uniref:t-SNARE n=1 Tax=Anaeromyces robustus TaxID=1754192 RepID=A0A1Y1X4J1_9FUNG|nr:t-SNARE [Anaeromyces robustus]|eukprot:ORX80731.1 t-SNARE [Anaeromyces robustus]